MVVTGDPPPSWSGCYAYRQSKDVEVMDLAVIDGLKQQVDDLRTENRVLLDAITRKEECLQAYALKVDALHASVSKYHTHNLALAAQRNEMILESEKAKRKLVEEKRRADEFEDAHQEADGQVADLINRMNDMVHKENQARFAHRDAVKANSIRIGELEAELYSAQRVAKPSGSDSTIAELNVRLGTQKSTIGKLLEEVAAANDMVHCWKNLATKRQNTLDEIERQVRISK